jgi:hypothetical protein
MDALERLEIETPSNTFHGRDVFAPVAAELAAGRTTPVCIGKATDTWTPAWIDEPDVASSRISGSIITVDAFGNLISNIDGSLIEGFNNPVAHIAGHDIALRLTYGNVQPGEYLALVNSFDVIEIAKSESSAAEGLGVERGAPVVVTDSA